MVLRGCLENALYGLYVTRNSECQETWLRRHDSKENKNKARKEFTIRKLIDLLKKEDHILGNIASDLYERTIDCTGLAKLDRCISEEDAL